MKEYSVRETEHGFQLVQNGLPIAFFDRERHPFARAAAVAACRDCKLSGVACSRQENEVAPKSGGLRVGSEAWRLLHELAMLHEPGCDADRDEWWTFYCGIHRISEKMVDLLAKTAKMYGYKKRMADEDKEMNP